jgi:hypothetical protein
MLLQSLKCADTCYERDRYRALSIVRLMDFEFS